MTTIDKPVIAAPTTAQLYRTAGIGALVAGIVYVVQPLLVFVLIPGASSGDSFPSPDKIASGAIGNTIAGLEFFIVGFATIFAAVALGRIASQRGSSTWNAVSTIAGIASGVSWLFMAGMTIANSGSVAIALSDITPDVPTQQVGMQAVNIVLTGFIAAVAFSTATWLTGLATAGRRLGVIGLPLAIACGVTALLIAVALLVLNVPFGILLLIPFHIGLGIALLVKSRRARV